MKTRLLLKHQRFSTGVPVFRIVGKQHREGSACVQCVKFWLLIAFVFLFSFVFLFANTLNAQEEFRSESSWQIPTDEDVAERLKGWLRGRGLSGAEASASVDRGLVAQRDRLNCVLEVQLSHLPEPSRWPELAKRWPEGFGKLGAEGWLKIRSDMLRELERERDRLLRQTIRTHFARQLTRCRLYDEALVEFAKLDVESSLVPEQLLFYRATAEHQLLKTEACLKSVNRLLENESKLPRRFQMLAKMMEGDLKPLKEDSLNEVARLMRDVRRRQSFYRSGKIVRDEEKLVMDKLDRIIKKVEMQMQQQQQGASGSKSAQRPLDHSKRAEGIGDGEVGSKAQLEGGAWGNLPPAKRAAALAEMAKDLPPHYRSVIEEYFRKLARENE